MEKYAKMGNQTIDAVVKQNAWMYQSRKQDDLIKDLLKKERALQYDMNGRLGCTDACVKLLIEICRLRSQITHAYYKKEDQWLKTFKENCMAKGKISDDYFEFLELNL